MIPAGRNDGGDEVSRKKEDLEATRRAQPLPGMNTGSMYVHYTCTAMAACTCTKQRTHTVYVRKGLGIFLENCEKPAVTRD